MNFLGIGLPEMAVVFLIAFLVLGPGKSIEMARTMGRIAGELRRSFSDLTAAVTLEEGQKGESPAARPRPGPGPDADPPSKEEG